MTSPDPTRLNALRLQEGAAQAWLYRAHVDRVRGVLYRVMGADDEVGDLTQEVFARAFVSVERYRGDEQGLGPWLAQVAVHTAISTLRKRKTRRFLRFAAELPERAAHTGAPETGQATARVFALLDRLPIKERVPLCLRWLEQMEIDEVAAACEISASTAKRRIRAAKARFDRLAARDSVLAGLVEDGA